MYTKRTFAGLVGLWALAAGCSDSAAPGAGTIEVAVATTGAELDPDGYRVVLDGGTGRSFGVDGAMTFTGLSAGSHSLALAGIAANCAAGGANPRSVDVVAGGTTDVSFGVYGTARTRLRVRER